jgi:hypothetical protein
MSTYSFSSKEEDIDVVRVLQESPAGTSFVLSEVKNRLNNKPLFWALFINSKVLDDHRVTSKYKEYFSIAHRSLWSVPRAEGVEVYLLVGADGRMPGFVRAALHYIKTHCFNPNDTLTDVTLI